MNHISLSTYSGLTTKFDIDDLRKLVWLWEWEGKQVPPARSAPKTGGDDENPFLDAPPAADMNHEDDNPFLDAPSKTPAVASKSNAKTKSSAKKPKASAADDPEQTPKPKRNTKIMAKSSDDEENPFLEKSASPSKKSAKGKERAVPEDEDDPFVESKPKLKDWTRGGMGFIVSQSSHYSKAQGSRVAAYGIGIEVELDIDKGMGDGMASVARWTAGAEDRRKDFRNKLEAWVKVCAL